MQALTREAPVRVTQAEFEAHVARMKELTGSDGKAPRSKQPRINVRQLVASLE